MPSQDIIDKANAFKAAMQIKTAKRNALTAAINAEGTAEQRSQWAALVAQDVNLHHDFYDYGTEHLPTYFPASGGT